MENKRRFPRFESVIQVKYCSEYKDAPYGYTISSDISRGGLRMPTSSGVVSKGDVVKLDMKADENEGHIFAIGKVRWLKKVNRDAPLDEEVGIEFIETNPADIERLINARL